MPGGEAVPGTLYVVATPLGHMEDMTLRALRVLREVSLVACEATRRTGALLRAHGIGTATTSYFEHNERWKGERILEALRGGRDVALVSDAGTPGISDPGFNLVRACLAENIEVIPIPGASSLLSALVVSGMPTDRFCFEGFLPKQSGKIKSRLKELTEEKRTMVFFESPYRLAKMLKTAGDILGDRPAFVGRELTKKFEQHYHGTLIELVKVFEKATVKGEVVVVISGNLGKKERIDSDN